MGYGNMGCYGTKAIRTPVMDQIAANGVKFTDLYSATPICTPSLCGLLTGRYPQRVGLPRVLFPKDEEGLTDGGKDDRGLPKRRRLQKCLFRKVAFGLSPTALPDPSRFRLLFRATL